MEGDPKNFTLVGHWDRFLTGTTKFNDTWVVELEFMDGGKNNALGPYHVIFIPASSKHITKQFEESILTTFLQPLFHDLESHFIHDFNVVYNCPPHLISPTILMCEDGKSRIQGMLMLWT